MSYAYIPRVAEGYIYIIYIYIYIYIYILRSIELQIENIPYQVETNAPLVAESFQVFGSCFECPALPIRNHICKTNRTWHLFRSFLSVAKMSGDGLFPPMTGSKFCPDMPLGFYTKTPKQ